MTGSIDPVADRTSPPPPDPPTDELLLLLVDEPELGRVDSGVAGSEGSSLFGLFTVQQVNLTLDKLMPTFETDVATSISPVDIKTLPLLPFAILKPVLREYESKFVITE